MNLEKPSLGSPRSGTLAGALALIAQLAATGIPCAAAAQEEPPCGTAPRAKPKRIKGGEGVPPLPLPATPLRRTERKRDPQPPLLVAKLRWGRRDLVWTLPDGRKVQYSDWNLDPNDIHRLLEALGRAVKVKCRQEAVELAGFDADPEEIPVLYAAGAQALEIGPEETQALREYLERGGFFLAVAHHGSQEFSDSIRRAAGKLFPDRPLKPLRPDHPLYRSHRRLDRVRYTGGTRDRPEGAPYLEAITIGCRAALALSPYDLCCEWDSSHLPEKYPGVRGDDAFALGVDILAYAMAYYPLGRSFGRWGRLEPEEAARGRGDFVFAQVRHAGHHDPHPAAFAQLLETARAETRIDARLAREILSLESPELAGCPFLYLTGHGDFRLGEAERAGLRRFLVAGGFLLADSCCGDLSFDVAFRRELAASVPEARLEPLPGDHPFFSCFYEVKDAGYTTAVRASYPDLEGPFLEALELEGSLRVAYSRFDLGNGWDGEDRPFALGYLPEPARRIGINAMIFALTH